MVKEECVNGHKMTPENCMWRKNGDRVRDTPSCRECKRIQRNRSRRMQSPAPKRTHRWYGDECGHGHVLTRETAAERMTSAGIRLRCRECERARERSTEGSRVKLRVYGDACPAGKHVLTRENAKHYGDRKGLTCLDCKRERDAAYKKAHPERMTREHRRRASDARKQALAVRPARRPRATPEEEKAAYNRRERERRILQTAVQSERLLGDELSKADDERPGAIWNLLKPTGRSLQALNELTAAQDAVLDEGGTWNCRDKPEAWMDSWLDETEDGERPAPPAPNRVRAMCEGCDVFEKCQNYGRVSRDPGIWGGLRVDTDGKIYD